MLLETEEVIAWKRARFSVAIWTINLSVQLAVAGALATGTRVTGIVLAPALLMELFVRRAGVRMQFAIEPPLRSATIP
ncbi:MAG: hypothetical protein ACJ72I_09160 [Pseudonocardiaceae bacterium]|jgi:Gpi18-like mannosyltransferase